MITFRRKLLLSLSVGLLCLSTYVAIHILVINTREADSDSQRRTSYGQLRRMLSAMKDAETGERGYLLTQNPQFLEPYRIGTREAGDLLPAVQSAFSDQYPAPIQDLTTAIHREFSILDSSIRLTRRGQVAQAVANAAEGKAVMDRIRQIVQQITESETALSTRNSLRLHRLARTAIFTVGLTLGLALLLSGAALASMFKDLTARAQAEAALRAMHHELEARVRERTRQLGETNTKLQESIEAIQAESEQRLLLKQQLWISNQRFQSAFENAAIGMGQVSLDGRFVLVNPRLSEITGYSEEELLCKTPGELTHPDDASPDVEHHRRLWAGDLAFYTRRKRYIRRDGTPIWIAVTVSLVRSELGAPEYLIGAVQDISDQIESERKLLESEKTYRFLADSMPQIVWTSGPDNRVNYYNQRWFEYTGLTRDQTADADWQSVMHPDDRQTCIDEWARSVAASEPFELEYRLKNAGDGVYRWHLGRALPLKDEQGRVSKWFGTATDIDDQKRSEGRIRALNEDLERRVAQRTADLAKSEERFRSIIEGVKDYAILMLGPKGTILSWNPGAECITGYSANEIVGTNHSRLYTAEDQQHCHAQLGLLTAAISGRHEEEGWLVRKDNSRFWANILITALRNEDGSLRGFSKITRDITERKLAEEVAARHSAELSEANAQLSIQSQRAEQASQAKSDFLAAMSHEVRTPMNAILGMSDLLWDSNLDAEQRRYVEVFRRAGNNLLTLINDILDLSKIESGRFELEQIEFDLEELFDRTTELVAPKAHAKGLELNCRLAPGIPTAFTGDPNRLQQVLINLLGNAIKFTASGQVLLTAVSDQNIPGRLTISVSDTGIGIAPEHLARIFDDFTQADSSTTRQFGGTGLGLAISRRLVHHMGGELLVDSQAGQGATFRFTIELVPSEQAPSTRSRTVEDFRGRKVLIVDDNATNRFIIRESVASWGLDSVEAGSLETAVSEVRASLLNGQPLSLVLLDCRMPDGDGFEAVQVIRQLVPDLPVIMLTSDNHPGDATRCQTLGVVGYALKPVKRADLLRLICRAMGTAERLAPRPVQPTSTPGALPSLPPLHILIAEDSPDNRLLLQAYLNGTPHTLTFAENGKIALDLFLSSRYDLVLMDMQMPVMDGLSATLAIRAAEQSQQRAATPIVALTANALLRDEEASRHAGCNAHLSKPVSKVKLLRAIEALYKPASTPAKLDIDIPPGFEEYAKTYLLKRRDELPELRELLNQKSFDRLGSAAHNLKGAGTSYGFPEITRIGAALEISATQEDAMSIDQHLSALSTYIYRASDHITCLV